MYIQGPRNARLGQERKGCRGPRGVTGGARGAKPNAERPNDLGLSCASNMAAPRSEVQAELCGPSRLPRQLQTRVRWCLAQTLRDFNCTGRDYPSE